MLLSLKKIIRSGNLLKFLNKIDEYVILGCSLGAIYIFSEIDWKLINSFEMISDLLDIEI